MRTLERRQTYVGALQQSEELFGAAKNVGYAARPVLIFYALSQGGRAIAAAASKVAGDEWKLRSHGIKAVHTGGALPDVTLSTDPPGRPGSFVCLSEILGSPVWGRDVEVPFVELWDCLPENTPPTQSLHDDHRSRRTPLVIFTLNAPDPHPLTTGAVGGLPAWLMDEPDRKAAFEAYIRGFPGARNYDSYWLKRTGREPDIVVDENGLLLINMNWRMPGGVHGSPAERNAYLESLGSLYAGSYYFLPDVPAAQGRMHPLMAWWAVLYALSMVARYEPAPWTTQLDINASRFAYPVERILDAALGVVPSLIAEAIDEVS